MLARLAENAPAPFTLGLALREADQLLLAAQAHAVVMAELGALDLPPAPHGDTAQLRAMASLYLASTLEAAGLVGAADDFTRLVRTGALPGELGPAAPLVEAFWRQRNDRINAAERLTLFGHLFGAPTGPDDAAGRANTAFEELLLDLCDAIMKTGDGGPQGAVRHAAQALAENLAGAANGMVQQLAREILDGLSQAIAILNHERVRAVLLARTMWDAVAAIDRRFNRTVSPTLTHLRRGRAGMAVLAWLAERLDALDGGGALVPAGDPVVASAADWVDETLSIVRGGAPAAAAPAAGSDWRDLGR